MKRERLRRTVVKRGWRRGCPSNRPRHGNVVVARACYVTGRVYREIPIAVLVTLCFVYIILPPDGRGIPLAVPRTWEYPHPVSSLLSSPFRPSAAWLWYTRELLKLPMRQPVVPSVT